MTVIGKRFLAAIAAALLAACANQQGDSRVERSQPTDPGYGPVIGDVKDGRTRAKAHTDLASAYYELGNLGVALEEVRIALAADPNYPPAYNVQGLINMDLKDNATADASFLRGLKLAPQDPDLNHNYGWFLCQTGREQQSTQWFLNAIRNPLYPTPSKSYAAAGRCLEKVDPAESAQFLDRALRIDPNNLQAMVPYAEYLYRRGQLQQAKELVSRYNRMLPEPTAESLWLAIRIERKLGDRQAEASLATQLRRRYSSSTEYQSLQRGSYD
jgi:type IV pilus assembly protein PilF